MGFSPSGGGGAPVPAVLSGGSSLSISNILLPDANTEVEIPLPASCKRFQIRTRSSGTLRIASSPGLSGTQYLTLLPSCSYSEDLISTSVTLYVQSPRPSQVVELVTWT